jgi:hypothetical protein
MTSTSDTATVILKQDRLGRVRTPREKRERILEEFERSGMSGQQSPGVPPEFDPLAMRDLVGVSGL